MASRCFLTAQDRLGKPQDHPKIPSRSFFGALVASQGRLRRPKMAKILRKHVPNRCFLRFSPSSVRLEELLLRKIDFDRSRTLPRASYDPSKRPQDRSRKLQDGPKILPRGFLSASAALQGSLRPSKTSPRGFKTVPGRLKMISRLPQHAFLLLKTASGSPKITLRFLQEAFLAL